jgi:3-phenylpropionate/trans-cinnamate dioxygenase ferredoxin component
VAGRQLGHDRGRSLTEPAIRRVTVARADDIPAGTMQFVQVDMTDVLIVHADDDSWHATQGICTHEYFELDKGFLTGDTLTCALHLSRFDLETGEALDPPAELPLALYPVEVDEKGQVVLTLPEGPIPINE